MIQCISSSSSSSSKIQSSKRTRRQMLATGFASPADNFIENRLNIHDLVVENTTATYFFRVQSAEYQPHFLVNDILVIDRSKVVQVADTVLIVANEQFSVARVEGNATKQRLYFYAKSGGSIEQNVIIWGVVTNLIRAL